MNFTFVERAESTPVNGHEKKNEYFECFFENGKADVAEHFKNVVAALDWLFGRLHFSQVCQVFSDFWIEMKEYEAVPGFFGKFCK